MRAASTSIRTASHATIATCPNGPTARRARPAPSRARSLELRQLKARQPGAGVRRRHADRRWSTCSAACRRACRCRGFSPIRRGCAAQQAAGRPVVRFARHPARLDRLPPDAPADRRHPAPLRGARARRARSTSWRSRATATRSSRSSPSGTTRRRAWTAPIGADRRPTAHAEPRSGAGARHPAVSRALRRGADAARRLLGLDARPLPVLRLGARLRRRSRRARERRLICGRCAAQWAFAPLTCPFCANDDRARITSFATRDGRYRVYACDVCRRYLKAYDARNAPRPVMVAVDTIATLPLDAAAMQRGYVG